ncbi:microfibril-associated glycoprotein 4-like [Ostrea edulis]|uniref:microfibril-associated glycoprotein 4-like n=1 Tax=Ostrea edulis TaxID=37623 RepID=UPI0024AEFC84|nr:microfibril-associated glycoprotein 4-like [Ostrea edulis]
MLCLVLCVLFLFHPLLTGSSGIKPHAFVKSEVGSFLKHAPWKHTDLSASLSGPMILTLQSKYKLGGGLVFRKTFTKKYRDCSEILKMKPQRKNRDGVYTIYPTEGRKNKAFCDMTTDGGGWTVIQRRMDGTTNFQNKKWKDFAEGFGRPDHEYWLGNNAMHDLTKSGKMKLRIDMKRFNGDQGFVQYSTFVVGSRSDKYKLKVAGFRGSVGIKDSFTHHNGMKFSTKDSDNDTWSSNCAASYGNGWWFTRCLYSNLNGVYYRKPTVSSKGITWYLWGNKSIYESLKYSKMMIKPKT